MARRASAATRSARKTTPHNDDKGHLVARTTIRTIAGPAIRFRDFIFFLYFYFCCCLVRVRIALTEMKDAELLRLVSLDLAAAMKEG